MKDASDNKPSRTARFAARCTTAWNYVTGGLWSDPRRKWWINVLRIINLSVNSFLNKDIQTQACAMTYRTMLAVVPALALFLAIGRGFDIQGVLQSELYRLFPAQRAAISYSMQFVDSYLSQTSEGLFLGVGIVFLIYTLISLLSNVEQTFNMIWGQQNGRSVWRKISDYTTMLLILPILMICVSGINLLLSNTLNSIFRFDFMTPVISLILEGVSMLMTFLFFTAVYILLPNTKVKFKYAFISGVIAGTGFMILQWLFVTGTVYVTKYNAIYGSFAFLPLMLLWMQLAWVICLAGTPATARGLMSGYDLPARLVTDITDRLCSVGILNRVLISGEKDVFGFQLAVDPSTFTVKELTARLYTMGTADFIPQFRNRFPLVISTFAKIESAFCSVTDDMLIADIMPKNPINKQPTY